MRGVLADRLYQAMKNADANIVKQPVTSYGFRSTPVELPFHGGDEFTRDAMLTVLHNTDAKTQNRILAAMGLSSRDRIEQGQPIDLPCLQVGDAKLLLLPGEAFVGYQLMAQELSPQSFVMAIGYGESWTGYIPTEQAFEEGFGHSWIWVDRGCEEILRNKMGHVLGD